MSKIPSGQLNIHDWSWGNAFMNHDNIHDIEYLDGIKSTGLRLPRLRSTDLWLVVKSGHSLFW